MNVDRKSDKQADAKNCNLIIINILATKVDKVENRCLPFKTLSIKEMNAKVDTLRKTQYIYIHTLVPTVILPFWVKLLSTCLPSTILYYIYIFILNRIYNIYIENKGREKGGVKVEKLRLKVERKGRRKDFFCG